VDLTGTWWWTSLAASRGVWRTLNNRLRTGTDKLGLSRSACGATRKPLGEKLGKPYHLEEGEVVTRFP